MSEVNVTQIMHACADPSVELPAILRPPSELPQTVKAKHPSLMALDFVANYDPLFPSIVAVKAKESATLESQRRTPVRKRTKPVDMRTSRSSLAASQNGSVPPVPTSGPPIGLKDTVVQESRRTTAGSDCRKLYHLEAQCPHECGEASKHGG